MLSLLLGIAALAVRVASYALLIYCVMSCLMPQSEWYHKLGSYIQPVLYPVRRKLYGWFPSLRNLPVDISPLALWLALDIAMSLINMLRRAL